MDRRDFLKSSGAFAYGFAGAAGFLHPIAAAAKPGSMETKEASNVFGAREGYSSQIGILVSMLNRMRHAILEAVQGLTVAQLDHLHDDKPNSIGALLLHLAAIERLYQINTFEGKKWGDVRSETETEWGAAARLGDEARKNIKGHQLAYYLGKLTEVRDHSLAELRKRDDAWLMQVDSSAGEPTDNYCKWFHVCEHESHHNGQVTWLKGRLPGW
jgi:uncharacterized damage-inducible protein DinB